MPDQICKLLVSNGAANLKKISKATGVVINVSPICLPCSEERIVKVEEGRGKVIEGVRMILKITKEGNS